MAMMRSGGAMMKRANARSVWGATSSLRKWRTNLKLGGTRWSGLERGYLDKLGAIPLNQARLLDVLFFSFGACLAVPPAMI